jgi:tetratricopeptide (TPR) repeat protein
VSHEIARGIAYRLGQPTMMWAVTFYEAAQAIVSGDCDEAERLATLAAEIGTASGQPDVSAVFSAQFGAIRRMQGRSEEIVDFMREVARENPGIPAFANSLAAFCIELDRFDEARDVLEPFMADGAETFPLDLTWLFMACQRAFVVAELGLTDQAAELFELLAPYADQFPFASATTICQVNHYLALLASSLGRYQEAEALFAEAASSHERIGAKWCLATTRLDWGQFLATRTDHPDLTRARTYSQQALDSAREHGYGHIARRAERNLRSLGIEESLEFS